MAARTGAAGLLLWLVSLAIVADKAGAQPPVMLPPRSPIPLDPFGLANFFGYLPDRWVARQPVGHQIIPTGPNGYIYAPLYEEDMLSGLPADAGEFPPDMLAADEPDPAAAAIAAFGRGDDAEALAAMRAALSIRPADARMLALASELMFARGEFALAADLISQAAPELSPEEWGAISRLACDRDTAAYTMRLRELEQWVRADPEQAVARLLLAWHYESLGHRGSALGQLRRMARARGGLTQSQRVAADLMLERLSPPGPAEPLDRGPREF